MKYEELIFECIKALKKYNPDIEGPDSFIETFLYKV